ncbi:MAG: bifunctional diguanylate cyclase/phosphodiesterase [Helicobacteraceae bacterium]|jgi:diguanylate cyclase (GGDEF)-like protein|nr:bifunctional diguanylate cyclase/phosphodiesterase [Helicobacteraceae bacterium]
MKNNEINNLKKRLLDQQKELVKLREQDALTNLPNRAKMQRDLREKRGEKALLIADINKFAMLGAVYGPKIADFMIQKIAMIIKEITPKKARIYRLQGDEFGVCFESAEDAKGVNESEIINFAQDLIAKISKNVIFYGKIEIRAAIAIGIAFAKDEEALLSRALIALQEAKSLGGANIFCVYSQGLETFRRQKTNLYWIPRVKAAIERQAIESWYQPIVCNKTREVSRYECLARLKDERGKIADPYLFLDAARISGILTAITRSMIAKSFKYFGGTGAHFSINITESDLQEDYLPEFLRSEMLANNLNARQITLEIVEDASAKSVYSHINQLLTLKDMGFLLAADDFGAANSNFSRIMAVDIDIIKIDGSFVKNIASNQRSLMIVKNMADFARSIGAKSVAEYVANREIYKKASEIGVDFSQGFYFGKPASKIAAAKRGAA